MERSEVGKILFARSWVESWIKISLERWKGVIGSKNKLLGEVDVSFGAKEEDSRGERYNEFVVISDEDNVIIEEAPIGEGL